MAIHIFKSFYSYGTAKTFDISIADNPGHTEAIFNELSRHISPNLWFPNILQQQLTQPANPNKLTRKISTRFRIRILPNQN